MVSMPVTVSVRKAVFAALSSYSRSARLRNKGPTHSQNRKYRTREPTTTHVKSGA
ncbi:hypothetical protein D3C72_2409390 [compost metagenome]